MIDEHTMRRLRGARRDISPIFETALDAVETLGNSGCVVAPANATAGMLRAGADAGDVTPETAARIWAAMLAAAD